MDTEFQGTLMRVLTGYAMQSPHYVVAIVGIILAVTRWRLHPRISAFALIGFGASLLIGLAMVAVYQIVPMSLYRGHNYAMAGTIMTVIGVMSSLLQAGCYAFLVAAIFCGRAGQQSAGEATAGPVEHPAA
jgi:hypothetical protein